MRQCKTLGISGRKTWTSQAHVQLRGLGKSKETERYQKIIDMDWELLQKKFPDCSKEKLQRAFADVSQVPAKGNFGFGFRCCLRSTMNYSFLHDRLVVPIDDLRVFGWKSATFNQMKMHLQRDLVGEACPLPLLAVMIWAIYLAVDFDGLFDS